MEKTINKKSISDGVFIAACLSIYVFFPAADLFQQIAATVFFLVIMPLAYKKLVLKEKIGSLGFGMGDWKKGLALAAGSLLAVSLLGYLAFEKDFDFSDYKLPERVVGSFPHFLLYELLVVPFFVLVYEIFFRGFLLFHFSDRIGYWAILLQFLVLLLMLSVQGFSPEFLPYLAFSPFAGFVSYKSNSIWYSFLGQYMFIFLVDISAIRMLQ